MTFEKLALHPSILKAILESGYTKPTPIQAQAIPQALAGHDLMASAQTGTGKTAAFVLPSLQRLSTPATKNSRGPRVLVLTPTRELANQVTEAAAKYGKHLRFRIGSIVGGMPYPPQMRLLSQALDILVATPGRLLDHMERGRLDYSRLEVLVLDEADRMLDMGFIHAVEKIAAATPASRQTLLFSATLEGNIAKLASRLLKNPQRIQIATVQERHENIEQRLHHVDDGAHKHRLLTHLLSGVDVDKAIVFTATKRGADRLAKTLYAQGHPAAALHGDMNQSKRNRTITSLRSGSVRLLVATDVAARGIDVTGITHVINYDLPKNAEDYVHRIGRTGRAGAKGIAISFAAPGDFAQLRDIERYTRQALPAQVVPGFEPSNKPRAHQAPAPRRGHGGNRNHGNRPRYGSSKPQTGSGSSPGHSQPQQRFPGKSAQDGQTQQHPERRANDAHAPRHHSRRPQARNKSTTRGAAFGPRIG